jgi:hypothetical protein
MAREATSPTPPAPRSGPTGITRRDVRQNTRTALQAQAVYANLKILDIPADVLLGTERARFAPPVRKAPPIPASSYLELDEDGE